MMPQLSLSDMLLLWKKRNVHKWDVVIALSQFATFMPTRFHPMFYECICKIWNDEGCFYAVVWKALQQDILHQNLDSILKMVPLLNELK